MVAGGMYQLVHQYNLSEFDLGLVEYYLFFNAKYAEESANNAKGIIKYL